jgi:hypothetical protein
VTISLAATTGLKIGAWTVPNTVTRLVMASSAVAQVTVSSVVP